MPLRHLFHRPVERSQLYQSVGPDNAIPLCLVDFRVEQFAHPLLEKSSGSKATTGLEFCGEWPDRCRSLSLPSLLTPNPLEDPPPPTSMSFDPYVGSQLLQKRRMIIDHGKARDLPLTKLAYCAYSKQRLLHSHHT